MVAGPHLTQLEFAAHDGPGRPRACQADGFSLDNCSIEQLAAACRWPDPEDTLDFDQITPLQEILIQHQWLGLQRT